MGLVAGLSGNAKMLSAETARSDCARILMDDEAVHAAFRLWQDVVILTDSRFIKVVAGTARKKGEISFGTLFENHHVFQRDCRNLGPRCEAKLYVPGLRPRGGGSTISKCSVTQRFSKGVDVYAIQKILADYTCR